MCVIVAAPRQLDALVRPPGSATSGPLGNGVKVVDAHEALREVRRALTIEPRQDQPTIVSMILAVEFELSIGGVAVGDACGSVPAIRLEVRQDRRHKSPAEGAKGDRETVVSLFGESYDTRWLCQLHDTSACSDDDGQRTEKPRKRAPRPMHYKAITTAEV